MTSKHLRSLAVTLIAGALFFFSFLSLNAQTRKPNIIVILADDMGYADIEPYGAKDIRTPNLNRLAREGVKLTNFYSNGPNCTPTRAALMTGRWQQRVGLEWATSPKSTSPTELPLSEDTIAETLKKSGYATAIFGKWHLGYDIKRGPLMHGFDEFFGILAGNADMYSHYYRTTLYDLWEGDKEAHKDGYLTDLLSDKAVDFIDRNAAKPFFLYVPYNAVHWPFQAPGNPKEFRTMANYFDGTREEYAKMLERMDYGIGQILQALDKNKLADDTLVIFTNDNGGERLSNNAPLFHHKSTLWEGGIRVPCLMRWKGKLPAGKVSNQIGITMDLTATAIAIAGANPPRKLDGMNLIPLLQTKASVVSRDLFWRSNQAHMAQRAIRSGKWKYFAEGENQLLFDLDADIGERKNLFYQNQPKAKELRLKFEAWEKEVAKNE